MQEADSACRPITGSRVKFKTQGQISLVIYMHRDGAACRNLLLCCFKMEQIKGLNRERDTTGSASIGKMIEVNMKPICHNSGWRSPWPEMTNRRQGHDNPLPWLPNKPSKSLSLGEPGGASARTLSENRTQWNWVQELMLHMRWWKGWNGITDDD